jgi:nanoRNase/pAp phosphatase (c-di-AMP/oligoRNAs hydrolase)
LQVKEIAALLKEKNAKHIAILCHHNADPDAVCSAYAFSQLLKRFKPDVDIEISAAQGPSKLSKQILSVFPIVLIDQPHIEEADILVLLDTNTVQQLDEWKPRIIEAAKPLIVIDHHAAHPSTKGIATLCIADELASSTCEIVYSLYKEANFKFTREEALALFLGIAYDTKHFILASSKAFKAISDLIDAGVVAEEALSLLTMRMDVSERIARLKAAKRMNLIRLGNWLVGFSNVSAYQASAARALLELGVDVGIVGGEKEGKLRISMRSTKQFYKETGIHLGRDIAKPLGEQVNGMGGGHAASAGVNGEGDFKEAATKCVRLFMEKLKC